MEVVLINKIGYFLIKAIYLIKDIFLIDDDVLVNFLNQETIKDSYPDINVRSFESATDALESIKKLINTFNSSLPQLILLDINMPVMDGWEFLEEFDQLPQHLLNHCKVIIHTSSIDPRDIEKAKSYPAVIDYITKPLNIQTMAKIFNP
jgi:CheY-like chemotaxis protein